MNKIRLIFLAVVLIILIVAGIKFNTFKSPVNPKISKISEFKITQISGNGNVFMDKNPIERKQLPLSQSVDMKRMLYPDEMYLMTDLHTSFEFYCFGASFTVLPNSYLYYQPKTMEIWFFPGEFHWEKKVKSKNIEISIKSEEAKDDESPPRIVTLSDAGRLKITRNIVEVWNYSGNLKFNDGEESYNLKPNQYLISKSRQKVATSRILHAPDVISPETRIISLNEPGDSIVKFSWRGVKGAQRYILRLFSSSLMENILYEKEVNTNRMNLDLLQFEDFGDFYWQVSAYDPEGGSEGAPSKLGYLKITGALLNKENILKPPELKINTFDVNGNLVLIGGETDKNASLFINDVSIPLNADGTFFHTVNFSKIGRYPVFFKVISASGMETSVERYATIFDE